MSTRQIKVSSCDDCPFVMSFNYCGLYPVFNPPYGLYVQNDKTDNTIHKDCPLRENDVNVSISNET